MNYVIIIHNGVIKWKHFRRLLARCKGNPPVTGGFALQRSVTQGFDVSFDLRLNKQLRKQSRRRWFETPLWRHRYARRAVASHSYAHFLTYWARVVWPPFADYILKWILLHKNVCIFIHTYLHFVPNGPINNLSALVQIMTLFIAMNMGHSVSMIYHFMMTSSNGNIFRVTGHLCGEFTGPRWIPRTKASDAELWCFLWSASE